MEDESSCPIVIVGMLFIGLPWLIFHYITKWKTAATLTTEDENLLDELHDLARRLDDRMMHDRADRPGRQSRTGARSAAIRSRPRSRTAPSAHARSRRAAPTGPARRN